MEFKSDFEDLEPYYRAFWANETLDRVAISVTAPRGPIIADIVNFYDPHVAYTESAERLIESFEEVCRHTFYGGLAYPYFWPNFGPDVFSAFLGAELKFSEDSHGTSWVEWSELLPGYDDLSPLEIRDDNACFQRILAITRAAAERSRGRYLLGITDLHAGFDALSVVRGGPERAALDLLEHPDGVKAALRVLYRSWEKAYESAYRIIQPVQRGATCWISLWAPGRMYSVQNDLSCLISAAMYEEFLLEELQAELDHLDYSIYHLDGVEALQHLDLLLDLPKLNAVQWVSGARFDADGIARWIPLFRKIQSKGKAIIVYPRVKEIPLVLESLKPEGLWLQVNCSSEPEAREVLRLCEWS